MLTYDFSNIGNESMYEYLYRCIKKDILEGKLKPDEKLPSKRSLAKHLGISVITIEGAYELLLAEGYIYSKAKVGFFVDRVVIPKNNNKIVTDNKTIEEKAEIKEAALADFTSNRTDSDVFPFSIWNKAMRYVVSEHQRELMQVSAGNGIYELRKNIARYLMEFRGMNVSTDQIIVGAGSDYLYNLLIQIIGRDKVYGYENPGYHKAAHICKQLGATTEYIDMDEKGVIIDQLENKLVDVINVSPAHHFPTGRVMPVSKRYELLSWASKKENRYIIEDEYDSELRLTGKPIQTLFGIDVMDKVIYMNTFSKTLCSTVRISYMILPANLMEKYNKCFNFYSGTVSNFEQYTLSKFIGDGSFEKHINRLRGYYQNKRNIVLKAIYNSRLNKYVSIYEEEAGAHFLMKITTKLSEKYIIKAAGDKGVILNPISRYYHGYSKEHENTYIINYSSINNENIDKVLDIIYDAINPD